MRGTSGISLALAGLGAVHALPTRTTVEERSPQIVLPPYTSITPGDPPPKNCQPEWVKFGICIPLAIPGEIIPDIPHKVKREEGEDKFIIGKPIVGPITPDKPNKPSKPWKWWLPPKDGDNKFWFGKPVVGPITPDKPVKGGEIKPSDKRSEEHDPIFIIGPPKVGPFIPDKPIKGGKIRPSDKRDKDPIFVIGKPIVGPFIPDKPIKGGKIIPDKPIKGGKIKPSDKRQTLIIGPPSSGGITPVQPSPPGSGIVLPPTKRSGNDHDPIFVIGEPIVGPFIPDKPIKGGKIKPSD